MSRIFTTIFTLLFFLSIPNLFATIIQIPDEYETLQAGINAIEVGNHQEVTTFFKSDNRGVQLSLKIPALDVEKVVGEDQYYDRFNIVNEAYTAIEGWPELPIVSRTILVPPSKRVRLIVNSVDSQINSDYSPFIVPEQTDASNYDHPGTPSDDFLNYDGFWPPVAISIGEPAILRGNRLVTVSMSPIQYNPATGESKVNSNFEFELVYDNGSAINPVERPDRVRHSRYVHKILRHLVVNPPPEPDRDDMMSGSYLYIVPEVDGIDEAIEPLIEWRKRQGHKVVVEYVRNNANSGEISDVIEEAYDEWDNPVEFVCLIGDADGGSYNLSAASGNGDYDYTLLDGEDPLPDIALGRISVNSREELDRVINKLVMYESDPWMENLEEDNNWFEQGAVVAGHSNNGLSTVLVARFTEQELYRLGYREVQGWFHNIDGEIPRGQNQQFVTDVFDWGISAFVYRAHIYCNSMPIEQISDLPNTDGRWPPVIAMTGNSGDYINNTGYSEAFFRSPGGGVGAVGIATGRNNVRFTNLITGGIFAGMYKFGLWTFGWGLNMGKYELWRAYDQLDNEYLDHLDWTNLIGDPGTHIWTDTPQIIAVDHAETISLGQSSFSVHVEDDGDETPLDYALVCVYKDNELHEVAYTDVDGNVSINILSDALNEGEMMVTVTKHNVKPYLGTVEIVEQEVYLGADSWELNDEEGGDGDNIANPGETITLEIELMNFGTDVPEGEVVVSAISLSPWAEVSADDVVLEENPEPGESVNIEFEVEMSQSAPDESVIKIELSAVNGETAWNSMAVFEVEAPRIIISDFNYIDGELLRGEFQWVDIEVTNVGSRAIDEFTGNLISLNSVISVVENGGEFPALEPGESSSVIGEEPAFRLSAHIFTIPGMQVELQLSALTEDGFADTSSHTIQISQPEDSDPFGPDNYGYICFDSNDEGWDLTPVYDWIEIDPEVDDAQFDGIEVDIRDTGDNQDESEVIELPFTFQYYGEEFNQITICSNGWAAFGDQHNLASFRNRHIAQPLGPNAQLAIFWDNLLASRGDILYYHDEDGGRFIIEWNDVRRLIENGQGANETFQIILYDVRLHPTYTGDGIIDFQYKDVTNQNARARNDTPYATVGIGNLDDSDGLEYTYWNQYSAGAYELEDGLTIRFTTAREYITGILGGFVTSASTGEPLVDATITTSRGFFGYTDENGWYMIDDILIGDGYGITASKPGYNDSTLFNNGEGFEIVEAETTFVNFALLHPEFNIDVNNFRFRLNPDDSLRQEIALSNDGDGTLIYTSKFVYYPDQELGNASGGNPDRDDADDIWDPLLQWMASDSVNDGRLQGIAFIDDYWIIGGAGDDEERNREESWFYKFDRWGNFIERLQQPVYDSRNGLLNLTYYEGFLYGVYKENGLIMKIDPESGDSLNSWEIPGVRVPTSLTIDHEGNFWVAATVNNIFKLELVGDSALVEIAEFERMDPNNPGTRIRNYGFSWFRDDPDGYNLYMVSNDDRTESFAIHKMHPETGDIRLLTTFPDLPEGSRGRGGICITPKWNNLVWVMGIVVDNPAGDFVLVTELAPNSSWIDYNPRSDTLFATESIPIELIIETADLDTGQYGVAIEFSHNAEGGSTIVEIDLIITTLSAHDDNLLPMEYSLEQNYPNPFNPSTMIRYSLSKAGLTKLSMFDIMGREVMELVNDHQPSGRYQLSLDGSNLSAGVYFYRIKSGEYHAVKKMLLIK